MRHRVLLTAAVAAASAGLCAPAAQADTKIGEDGYFVHAWDGLIVWSQLVGDRHQIWAKEADGEPLRIQGTGSSTGPMSVDVGRGAGGRPRLVYQRCPTFSRCDIYRIDPATQVRERKLGFSTKRDMEVAPSQWRGTYVFGRTAGAQAGRSPSKRGGMFVKRPGSSVRRWTSRIPTDTDIRGSHIAYAYLPASGTDSTYIFLTTTTSRKTCRVARGDSAAFVTEPTLDGGYVYWLVVPQKQDGDRVRIRRAAVKQGSCEIGDVETSSTTVRGFENETGGPNGLAVDDGTIYVSNADQVTRLDDPGFPAG